MRRALGLLLASVVLSSLAACVGLPTYAPAPHEPLARVKLSPNIASGSLGMCTSKGQFRVPVKDGYVEVPTDQRVGLWHTYVASGYQVTYHCAPGMSFDAYENVVYYADFEVRAEKCSLAIYREDKTSRAGLAFDATVAPLVCPR